MSGTSRSLFESLYLQSHPMVLQMCLGFMKGDKDLANDLSQEVFINIWNALPGFKGDSSHKTWIYRITVNTCLQYIRKEKNIKKVPISDLGHTLLEEPGGIADSEYKDLYRAIGQLNEIDRLVIMMVLEELEYEEISKVIGINATNLRVKIHRIKSKLKKTLDHEY